MTFVFWGLFVVLALIVVGYYWWMVRLERGESTADRPAGRPEREGP